MKKIFEKYALHIAKKNNFNPILAGLNVVFLYLIFISIEAIIETLIFGQSFAHPLDYLFAFIFVVFSFYTIFICNYFKNK